MEKNNNEKEKGENTEEDIITTNHLEDRQN